MLSLAAGLHSELSRGNRAHDGIDLLLCAAAGFDRLAIREGCSGDFYDQMLLYGG